MGLLATVSRSVLYLYKHNVRVYSNDYACRTQPARKGFCTPISTLARKRQLFVSPELHIPGPKYRAYPSAASAPPNEMSNKYPRTIIWKAIEHRAPCATYVFTLRTIVVRSIGIILLLSKFSLRCYSPNVGVGHSNGELLQYIFSKFS